jgi:hypothetical protein
MHLSIEIWTKECRFFSHPINIRSPKYVVSIPHFARKLLPVQAHSVYQTLQWQHGEVGSIILALSMGIGKTTIAICVHHIQNVYNIMWEHIRKHPTAHVDQANGDCDNEEIVCPSYKQLFEEHGFACPCAASSPGHFIRERLGVSMVITPTGLLDTWKYEFNACFCPLIDKKGQPVNNKYGYQLARAHANNKPTTEQWALITGKEEQYLARDMDVEEGIPQQNKRLTTSAWYPRLDNGKVIILSTSDSVIKKFIEVRENRQEHQWTYRPTRWKTDPATGEKKRVNTQLKIQREPASQRCVISTIFKDECHLRRAQCDTGISGIRRAQNCLYSQKKHKQGDLGHLPYYPISHVWMSGTPLITGPSDIARWVELMVRDRWAHSAVLKEWMGTEMASLGREWTSNILNPRQRDEETFQKILRALPPIVERLFLRFTTESIFIDQPCVEVPKNIYRELWSTHPGKWQAQADAIAEEEHRDWIRRNNKAKQKFIQNGGRLNEWKDLKPGNSYYRSRVVATLPYLGIMTDEDGHLLRLTNEEFKAHVNGTDGVRKWTPGKKGDPYFDNLEAICASSGKLESVKNKLAEFDPARFQDMEGKPSRHIFCSYFYVVVHVLEMVSILSPVLDLFTGSTKLT